MNNKKKIPLFIFAVMLCITVFSFSSFATYYYASDENRKQSIPEYIENISVATENVSVPDEAKNNTYELTPDGNLTLLDDYCEQDASNEVSQKQFLTVTTKSGNTFYIVVDRDGNTDNVYLLNLVDEADLMALINDEEVKVTTTESTTEEESSTEKEENDEEKEGKSNSKILLLAVVLFGGGGFAYYWFMVRNAPLNAKISNSEFEDDSGFDDDFDENNYEENNVNE